MELIKYKITEHIKYEINGGDIERVLIIPINNDVPDMKNVLCLSDTSLYIWKMIIENKNINQILEEISRLYGKDKNEITDDVEEFLNTLLGKGYISVME